MQGTALTKKVADIYLEFNEMFNNFGSMSYEPCSPHDNTFVKENKIFEATILDYDRRLASIFGKSFEECNTLTALFKVSEHMSL